MKLEGILKEAGDFNRYQKLLLLLTSVILMIGTPHVYVQVFAAGKSDHWCKAWESEECSESEVDCEVLKKNLSIPYKYQEDNSIEYEKCVKYNVSGISLETAIELRENVSSLEQIPCDEGWDFDLSIFPSTINIDFELVCERSYLPNIGQSTFFAGYLVGSFLGGMTADMIGRRKVLLISLMIAGLVTTAIIFAPNVGLFIFLRFWVGFCLKSIGLIQFVLLMETASVSKRVFLTNVYFVFFALGYFLLAGAAKLIHGWRILQLTLTLPYVVLFGLSYFFILESPRWLLTKGKTEEARDILKKIATINKRKLDEESFTAIEKIQDTQSDGMKTSLKKIIRSPVILAITLNMCFNWAVQSLVYYGLSLSTSSLGIDPYLSFVISGAIEIPAYFACMFVADWLGRRGAVFTVMLLGGLCCCSSTLLPMGLTRALLAMGGKFFITMSFSIVYTWAAELFPTSLRLTAVGLFSMSSRVGGITAPIVLLFEDVWTKLPYIIFGCFSITAGVLSLLIPETSGKPLPTTVRDMKTLYKRGKLTDENSVAEDINTTAPAL